MKFWLWVLAGWLLGNAGLAAWLVWASYRRERHEWAEAYIRSLVWWRELDQLEDADR